MHDLLVKVARSQKDDYSARGRLPTTDRDIEPSVKKSINSSLIKAIMGPRRAGKSTLVQKVLAKTPHAHFNFEDERLPFDIDTDMLLTVLENVWGKEACKIYFFDEIQNLNRWEQFLHRLHQSGKNIFITGSNSRLLSKELATALTGRYVSHMLLPFSWNEAQRARGIQNNKETFYQYLTLGGFPDVVLEKAEPGAYLTQLWAAILSRDIAERYKIRNVPALRALAELVLRSTGSHVSGRSLQKSLPHRLSNTTLENYLSYGEEAFLFEMLQKFEPSLAKQKKADRKPYVYDSGFIKAIRPSLVSMVEGQLLENFVFLNLIRRGAESNINLFYYQNARKEEVDFVYLNPDSEPSLIQVCWTLKDSKTFTREVRALVSAAKDFGVKHAEIITFDEEHSVLEENVEISVKRAF